MYEIADKYLLNNLDEAIQTVRKINDLKDGLEHLYLYDNDERFFDTMFEKKYEIVLAIAYGNYNIEHEFVKIDGYNVTSYSKEEYYEIIKDNIKYITDKVIELNQEEAMKCLTRRFMRVLEWL